MLEQLRNELEVAEFINEKEKKKANKKIEAAIIGTASVLMLGIGAVLTKKMTNMEFSAIEFATLSSIAFPGILIEKEHMREAKFEKRQNDLKDKIKSEEDLKRKIDKVLFSNDTFIEDLLISEDKGIPLMTPTFSDKDDPNIPKYECSKKLDRKRNKK